MLSIRLKSILELIDVHDYVADIGTDHGYLLIGALDKGVNFVQGIDNKEGPYKICCKNLERAISENKAIVTLNDGLKEINEKIDTIVIAGMGGELISQILASSIEKAKKLKKIILQPNVRTYELRKFLNDHNFSIVDEKLIYDMDKYYEILNVRFDENHLALSTKELIFGPILLKKKGELFIQKWEKILNEYEKIVSKNSSNKPIDKLNNYIILIKEVLN